MRAITAFAVLCAASAAQAHPSFVPHQHPHGVSMLPDLGASLVAGIVVLALAIVALTAFRRSS
jgi:hypothetical protein